jgi:hypothetical protein
VKPIRVFKFFCSSDVPSSSLTQHGEGSSATLVPRGSMMKATSEHAAHVIVHESWRFVT